MAGLVKELGDVLAVLRILYFVTKYLFPINYVAFFVEFTLEGFCTTCKIWSADLCVRMFYSFIVFLITGNIFLNVIVLLFFFWRYY